ncbi:hypothetical protein [Candidatus Sororendozoicomonas aggregata]|uniref:hypothetical protein n=1 Tax=Candidatus Sororendozoicomonas aggregata TaxID=3073239 RepID=UPI002ED41ECD
MFHQNIQFPSFAVVSFVFLSVVFTGTANATVYSVTAYGDANAISEVKRETFKEHVDVVSKLQITVPYYSESNYVEIKADLYYTLNYDGLTTANNNGQWFGFTVTDIKHGGPFHREKYTLHVWCNSSGSDGFIVRPFSHFPPETRFIVGHISCATG